MVYFSGWRITERLNSFQILLLYLYFLVEEVVLQICHYFNGHKFYSNVNLDKTKLKNSINFKFKF